MVSCVIVGLVMLTGRSASRKLARLGKAFLDPFAEFKEAVERDPGIYLGAWDEDFGSRIQRNGGPRIVIETQPAYVYLFLHSVPQLRAVGRRGEQDPSVLSGEELKLFGKEELGNPLRNSVKSLRKALSTRSLSQIYKALSNYSFIVTYRTPLEYARQSENVELLEENLVRLRKCLKECVEHLELNRPGKARRAVRPWWKQWRYERGQQDKEYMLPPESLPLVRCVVESIFDVYGDTVEWTKRDYHIRDNKSLAELINKSLAALSARDYTHSMNTLGEFERILPQPFEPARFLQ